jgi:hypothetical protein
MWTEITCAQYDRGTLRYASDLTDEESFLTEPLLPARKEQGQPRITDLHEVLNAILYIPAPAANGGCCRGNSVHAARFSDTFTLGAAMVRCVP